MQVGAGSPYKGRLAASLGWPISVTAAVGSNAAALARTGSDGGRPGSFHVVWRLLREHQLSEFLGASGERDVEAVPAARFSGDALGVDE
ncbi:hypothetical protein GCM10027452_17190 [Micromonospora halotolerans]